MSGGRREYAEKRIGKEGFVMNGLNGKWVDKLPGRMLALGALWIGLANLPAQGEWYLEAGAVYRGDMKISVEGGSRAADSGISASRAGTAGGFPAVPSRLLSDDGTAQILRQFDDGYVGPSGWAWARNDGWTQFWGYDATEQYDAVADTLTFRRTVIGDTVSRRRTVTRVQMESAGWDGRKRTDGFGLMATVGYLFRQEKSWNWAIQARVGWLDNIQADFRNRPAYRQHVDRSVYEASLRLEETYTYTYDTLGNPAFPAAPYEMADPSAVGPMIADTPETIAIASQNSVTSDRLIHRSRETATSHVDLDVDVQAFTLQLGPRLLWNPAERLALFLQPALTLNLIDATLRRRETFRHANGDMIAAWDDRQSDQAWRIGAGGQIGARVAISQQWHVIAAGGYDWVDTYRRSVGPDRVKVNLSGYQGELALGRTF